MNKGFQALPEYVQRKIDPEMAKQYYGGGSVMQRPLFRQMGGPAAPQMMGMEQPQVNPQDVAQVQGMEELAMGQGQEMGQAYASEMMTNIDAADDAKGLIDAFRGNEKPLESRYAELAGFVGEADAQQTPESVLAMVQPTIMMTEEGAIDSGIGELMQSLVQDVGMAEGEQMSQGVGELMAMGAGNTPPVNFNQGGAVRHYAEAGAVTDRATTMLPEFQNLYASVLGDPTQRQAELDEQKRMTQAQMLFDIAQAGLQFAGTTQGNTIAERLANAAAESQVFPRIGERAAGQLQAKQALEAEKRQMDLAALQSSLAEATAQRRAKEDIDLAVARQSASDPSYKRVISADGTDLGTFNVNDALKRSEFETAIAKNPGASAYNLGTKPNSNAIDFKSVKLYPKDGVGDSLTVNVRTEEDYTRLLKLTGEEGEYTASPEAYTTRLAEEKDIRAEGRAENIDIRAEGRAEKITIRAENRALNTTLSAEARALSTQIGKEGRAEQKAIAAEARALNTTLSEEERAEARRVAAEARAEAEKIRGEIRNNGYDLDAEKRKIEYDIAAEGRAVDREQTVYERNRADDLSDIAAAIKADIAAEERRLQRTLNTEERANIEFNRRFGMETESQIAREERALGRTLTEEERANAEFRARQAVETQQRIQLEASLIDMRGNYTFREQDGEIVAIDNKTAEVTPIFGTPDVSDPEYAEITLPNAEGVLTKSIVDITSPQGLAAIAKVNEVTADGGQAGMQKISTASVTPRGFLIPQKGVFTSFDGGRTYVDENGVTQSIPGDAYEVSSTIAYEVAKSEKVSANAREQLAEMDRSIISGMTDAQGNPLTAKEMMEVKDAYEQARKGTGFWSKIFAGIDATIGGVVASDYFAETFKDTQEARKFTKMVRVLGRSALAVSPRFAVADLQTVEQLFPSEETLFANPATEAKKLQTISMYLGQQKRIILENLGGGVPLDSTMKSQLNQKLFEINRLQEILGPIDFIGSQSNEEAFDEAKKLIDAGVKK
tara:strand:+ start:49 stop:3075 length:3027 start_codon:yes stop_codon:yes gene_type:complete